MQPKEVSSHVLGMAMIHGACLHFPRALPCLHPRQKPFKSFLNVLVKHAKRQFCSES